MPTQLSIFNQPTLNVNRKLKEQMAKSAKTSGLSRDEILERMNRLAAYHGVCLIKGNGHGLTMTSFEKWLNPEAKEHVPAINAVVLFCAVLNDLEPLKVMLAPLGADIIEGKDIKLLSWAKEYQRAKEAKKKMRKLEAEL